MPSFAIVFYSLIFDFTTILAAAGLIHQQQHEFCLISVGTRNQESEIDLKKKEDRIWIILPSSFFLLSVTFVTQSAAEPRLPLRVLRSFASFPQTVLFPFFGPRVASQIALSLQRLAVVRV